MFYRSLIAFYEKNNFSKHPSYRTNKKTTGFADYVYASMCLFSIILGSNLGCRARQDYEKLPTWGFKIVTNNSSRIGLWVLEAFVKKHNGSGKRRCPTFILDLGRE